jgi:hypothetical protein
VALKIVAAQVGLWQQIQRKETQNTENERKSADFGQRSRKR